MKVFLSALALWFASVSGIGILAAEDTKGIPAAEALALLKTGNAHFAAHKAEHPHTDQPTLVRTATKGQHPFATILSCSDSRVPVELLFDQGVGDLFVIRVAGNVCGTDELGTIEYGVEHLQTHVVVVLGHTGCGAVTAAATHARLHGNLAELIHHVDPAVEQAQKEHPSLHGKELVPSAIETNVRLSIDTILRQSEEVRKAVAEHHVELHGAIYHLDTGVVEWLPDRQSAAVRETKR